MSPVLFVLLLCLRTAQLRHHQGAAPAVSAGSREPFSPERTPLPRPEGSRAPDPKRVARGAGDGTSRRRTPDSPRRPDDPSGYFTTRRVPPAAAASASARPGNDSSPPGLLHPALRGSRWAYVITLLALGLLAAGVVGNLALTCAVWHDLYLQSAWNHVLAGLALCDLLVLLTCLPVVVFHALTSRWLLGDLSCRLVPYVEVTSLGVATFSLCALSIDRFHAATGAAPSPAPRVEPCQSILSKLSVIWVGSMVLAAPELLLWQLRQQAVVPPPLPGDSLMAALRGGSDASKADVCVREPSADLPEGVFPLVLTYHEARAWWIFGCYLCLPLLFTVACDLVTRCSASYYSPSASSPSPTKHQLAGERRLRTTVMALAALYGACNLPESVCNIVLAYVPAHASAALPALALPALSLAGQFLLFARCSASPVLLLCLCRSLGQAFMDCCCCCCCQECVQDGARPSSSASTAATTSNVSSPASPSPTSLSPTSLSPSGKDETTKSLLAAKDSPAAVGTPC
uniref:G-protein coupled receptors family 1 profile domain-containing protein n=1 Tax=Gasterosteus aculeatus aculeatus TaxID=481459 RepID=G3NJ60_GASAC